MQANIHPKYHSDALVTCICGNTFTTGSTIPEIKVEICSACHPFFTGEMRFVDVQGRVEKFQQKQKAAGGYQKKSKKNVETKVPEAKSLKEMLSASK